MTGRFLLRCQGKGLFCKIFVTLNMLKKYYVIISMDYSEYLYTLFKTLKHQKSGFLNDSGGV